MIAPHILNAERITQHPANSRTPRQFVSAHLVGICGSGMKALAELLTGLGWKITGSDLQTTSPQLLKMRERGVRIHAGHNDTFVPQNVDVLVYSPAVGASNPERRMAERLGIPCMSYSQMLGHLMRDRVGIAIAGTHGKSTTTAMTATILRDSHLSCSAVIGAELCGTGVSGFAGSGRIFVAESCEYQRSFLDLSPRFAAILGIEPDHFDCFKTFDETKAAFASFAERVEEGGVILVRRECAETASVVASTSAEVVTFSDKFGADWCAADARHTDSGTRFRVFFRGEFFGEFCVPLRGQHNVLNALAAIALSHHSGASADEIRDSLAGFPGIRRRFETIGWWRGVTLVDDYAHHPTAVAATLATAREQFGKRRVWCVFQPHQVSRTMALMAEFAASFSAADEIVIAPVFAARESLSDEPVVVAEELAERVQKCGKRARFCASLDRILATLDDEARPGDVVITMGAGDIDRVHHEFTRRVSRRHTA